MNATEQGDRTDAERTRRNSTYSPSGIPLARSRNSSSCLRSNGVRQLIDIRTIPKSRTQSAVQSPTRSAKSLRAAGIGYLHLKAWAGCAAHARFDRISAGATRAFAVTRTTCKHRSSKRRSSAPSNSPKKKTTALMCAEAVPWRCHRSLVSDALIVRGIDVKEIIGSCALQKNKADALCSVHGTQITYPKAIADKQSLRLPDAAGHLIGERKLVHGRTPRRSRQASS